MLSSMDTAQKVRENRLRSAAARQGLKLSRCRTRDPRALDYGTYRLTGAAGELVLKAAVGEDYSDEWDPKQRRLSGRALAQRGSRERLTLHDVEAILTAARPAR